MSIFIAMLKKDLRVLLGQRQALYAMIIAPLFFSIILPVMLVGMTLLDPSSATGLEALFAAIPAELEHLPPDLQQLMMLIDNMLPGYFLMIPIMSGSILAASGFVTEREHKTMEALFYTPLSVGKLLAAKLFAALIPSLLVSWLSALLTGLTINIACLFLRGIAPFPTRIWWLILFWLLPIFASLGLTFSVLVSAGSKSFQEAQQKSGMLVVPLILLMVGPMAGLFSFTIPGFALLGAILLLFEIVLLFLVRKRFSVEKLI